jgi:hypothetical protein
MGNTVIPQFICPLVGYRFCSLRHVSAHVVYQFFAPGIYIRGEWGKIIVYQFIASATAAIVAISMHF